MTSLWSRDGRVFEQTLLATLATGAPASETALRSVLCSPAVGLHREPPAPGTLITPGAFLGDLEILGRLHRLEAPSGAFGVVVEWPELPRLGRRPVGYGEPLLWLDPEGASGMLHDAQEQEVAAAFEGLVFRSPSSGRFYARPAPDKSPFVVDGGVVTLGQTVALLEVMKTFNRLQYGGPGLPERATVTRVVPADGADLTAGDVILELAAAD